MKFVFFLKIFLSLEKPKQTSEHSELDNAEVSGPSVMDSTAKEISGELSDTSHDHCEASSVSSSFADTHPITSAVNALLELNHCPGNSSLENQTYPSLLTNRLSSLPSIQQKPNPHPQKKRKRKHRVVDLLSNACLISAAAKATTAGPILPLHSPSTAASSLHRQNGVNRLGSHFPSRTNYLTEADANAMNRRSVIKYFESRSHTAGPPEEAFPESYLDFIESSLDPLFNRPKTSNDRSGVPSSVNGALNGGGIGKSRNSDARESVDGSRVLSDRDVVCVDLTCDETGSETASCNTSGQHGEERVKQATGGPELEAVPKTGKKRKQKSLKATSSKKKRKTPLLR